MTLAVERDVKQQINAKGFYAKREFDHLKLDKYLSQF